MSSFMFAKQQLVCVSARIKNGRFLDVGVYFKYNTLYKGITLIDLYGYAYFMYLVLTILNDVLYLLFDLLYAWI